MLRWASPLGPSGYAAQKRTGNIRAWLLFISTCFLSLPAGDLCSMQSRIPIWKVLLDIGIENPRLSAYLSYRRIAIWLRKLGWLFLVCVPSLAFLQPLLATLSRHHLPSRSGILVSTYPESEATVIACRRPDIYTNIMESGEEYACFTENPHFRFYHSVFGCGTSRNHNLVAPCGSQQFS